VKPRRIVTMTPNKLAVYFVADIFCGRYGFGRYGCGRYGLWPIWSHPQLNTHISQGNATTDLRLGGRFNSSFFRSLVLKELLKSVYICNRKNKSGTFLWPSMYTDGKMPSALTLTNLMTGNPSVVHVDTICGPRVNPLWAHTTTEQWTIIQQYGDSYTAAPPSRFPHRCTKCDSPLINGQFINFILFDVAL